nr:helix-turn-helix domain-containing protein [Lachnospiraceae bacterium]
MQRFIMSKEYLEELSQRIREYRISADMTQQELADASGISLR